MGTSGGSDGGDRSSNNDGLRGLPPEWGTIVVPDDAAELADEAAAVRRELRRATRQSRWRRRFGVPARFRSSEPSLGLPLLIMAIAVIATLTSLFAVAWPKSQRQTIAGDGTPLRVPEVTLYDERGAPVKLPDVLPGVVVLVDGCECAGLLTELAGTADPKLSIVAVARKAPKVAAPPGSSSPAPRTNRVRALADPTESLRTALGLPKPSGSASVAIYSASGELINMLPTAKKVDEFRGELTRAAR